MKKWIIPVVIVAAGAAGFAVYQKQHADRQPENIIASNGRLELERIDVATLYAGRVKSMNVDEGSEVKAGDVLAELSSDTTSGRVEEAQAGELAAKEMVQRAQAGVKQAQEAVARADAQIAAQLQQQKLAQMELDNAGKMQSEDLVSPAETQRRRSQRDGAAAAVKAAQAAKAEALAAVRQAQPSQGGAVSGKAARVYQGRGVAQLRWFAGSTPQATGQFVQTQLAGGKSGGGKSSGTFAFRRPGHFRWQIEKPDPQLIVTDGRKLHFYDEGLKQVTVREATEAIQATPAAVLFGVGKLDDAFTLTEGEHEGDLYWVEAVPKSPDSGFDRIRIGLRNTLPAVMDVVDAFGQVNRFEFRNLKVKNVNVPASLFEFTPPAGVDVLE